MIGVTDLGFDLAGGGDQLLHLGEGLFESGLGNISHEDIGTFFGEEDGGFKTDATVWVQVLARSL